MSFRESVIIPYSLFKKCQFASPLPPPPPRREPTPEDEPPAPLPDTVHTPEATLPTQTPPLPLIGKKEEPTLKTEAKTWDYATMARVVPEEDRPILENILERIEAHPQIIRWNKDFEVVLDGVTYPRSNVVEILKFIMKKQTIENNVGAPFGAREFVDNLLKIKVPKEWIKVTFKRKSKRKKGAFMSENDDDDDYEDNERIKPFDKKPRLSQSGSGLLSPWLSY